MKQLKWWLQPFKDQRGVSAVLVAILLIPLFGFLALAIDIGLLKVTKNELQNVADAAALAGGRQLGEIYSITPSKMKGTLPDADIALVKQVALDAALANKAAGVSIVINAADLDLGIWHFDSKPHYLESTSIGVTAMQVTARRDATINGAVQTFIAKVIGISSMDVSAVATASLSGAISASPGLPITIGEEYISRDHCDKPLTFYPTPGSCTGWTTFSDKANSDTLKDTGDKQPRDGIPDGLLPCLQTNDPSVCNNTDQDGVLDPTGVSDVGDRLNMIGGTVTPAYTELKKLFDLKKGMNDGFIDADTNSDTWTTQIPVIDLPCGQNPNKDQLLDGFATITIKSVDDVGNTITADMVCDIVKPGRSGGNPAGYSLGTIPNLVQ